MRKLATLTAAAVFAVVFGYVGSAVAAPIFVNDGTTEAAPCDVTPDFNTVQGGVDDAIAGDTVFVCPGTYNESVVISTDDITLKGQVGAIIDGAGLGANGITLSGVSGVTIEGFDIRNHAGGLWNGGVGIILVNASNNHVKGNTISDSNNAGIVFWFAGDNIVEENEISGSTTGIRLFHASNHNEIRKNVTSDSLADIPQMPSKSVEIVLPFPRQGNCIPSAAIRWPDFGDRPSSGTPFAQFSAIQTDPSCRFHLAVDFPGLRRNGSSP